MTKAKVIKRLTLSVIQYLALISLLLAFYFISGFLGLKLSLAPGYATAIWPPSGIALGFVLLYGPQMLPGVFLGSLFVNLTIACNSHFEFGCLNTASLMAMGAVFQALTGYILIKRFISLNDPLLETNKILMFAFLTAIVSSLVNASWSSFFLWVLGRVENAQLLINWLNWYIGDALGILVFTPICLILAAKPRNIWKNRIYTILIPILLSFVVIIATYQFIQDSQLSVIKQSFNDKVRFIQNKIQEKIIETGLLTESFANFIANQNSLENSEFNAFAKLISDKQKSFYFIAYYKPYPLTINKQKRLLVYNKDNKENKGTILKKISDLNFKNINKQSATTLIIKEKNDRNVLFFIISPVIKRSDFALVISAIDVNILFENLIPNIADFSTLTIKNNNLKIYEYPLKNKLNNVANRIKINTNTQLKTYNQWLTIKASASRKFIHDRYSWYLWFSLFGSVLFCGTLSLLLFIIAGQRKLAEDNINKKEKELALESIKSSSVFNYFNKSSFKDSLTKLPNRKKFLFHLEKSIESAKINNKLVAVCLIDLDNFKWINENFGHNIGDNFLIKFAKHCQKIMRKKDFFSRIGDDEFAVILEEIDSVESVKKIIGRYFELLKSEIEIKGYVLKPSINLGISIYPDSGDSLNSIIKKTFQAMSVSKISGKNKITYFDKSLEKEVTRYVFIRNNLIKALNDNEFYLVFQPIIKAKEYGIYGFEVLSRWQSNKIGAVPPPEFIRFFEQFNQIKHLNQWFFPTLKKELSPLAGRDLFFSLNMSAKQFEQKDFIDSLESMSDYFDPKNIILEITETTLLTDIKRTSKILHRLSQLNFKIALDDFGTGYSSLYYLNCLPIDILKIDKSFINNTQASNNDIKIIHAIIELGKALNLTIIAEGVETKEQLTIVENLGCDYIQGFYFSKPKVLNEFKLFGKEKK